MGEGNILIFMPPLLAFAPRMKRKKRYSRKSGLRRAALLVGGLAATGSLSMCSSSGLWGDGSVEEVVDVSRNVSAYRAAAQRNDRDAQFRLGCCYLDGLGVSPSRESARYWLQLAAAQGHRDARELLSRMG